MPADEFEAWREFYTLFPFDDRHRYHRPAVLLAAQKGVDVQAALDWLQPPVVDSSLSALRAIPGVKFHPRTEV